MPPVAGRNPEGVSRLAEVIQITVGETVADFLADCEARNLSPRTIVWYEQRLSILRPEVHP